jgi:uncharacterized membrane protein YqjE
MPTDLSAEISTPELLREALAESKELVRLEIRLAQEELREDVRKLKGAGILLASAAALSIVALAMFSLALVLAWGGTVGAALIVAFIVLTAVVITGFIGYRLLPKVPLERTRSRLATDVRTLKEQVT